MITKIAHNVYKSIRERAGLSIAEVAAAIGRERQIVYRIEGGEQLLNAEQEAALIKKANLSIEAFTEIMCKALAKLLGRRVMIAPKSGFRPASPLIRSDDLYSRHHDKLAPEVRDRILARLHLGRLFDAAADQAASLFEKEIRQDIEDALGPEALLETDED